MWASLSLQNGSGSKRWRHASAYTEERVAVCGSGCGALVYPLPPHFQGNTQIHSFQLHSAVWCFASCQVDHLLHGWKVKWTMTPESAFWLQSKSWDTSSVRHSSNNRHISGVRLVIWFALCTGPLKMCAFLFVVNLCCCHNNLQIDLCLLQK